jgi:TatD DNase family protein
MTMFNFVDIHTHNINSTNQYAIINLKLDEIQDKLDLSKHEYFSIGIHPWDVHRFDSKMMQTIEKHVFNGKVKAIGECGLDKNSEATLKAQMDAFEKQILIAENIRKPVIVHCVGYFNELISLKKILKPSQAWIIHGFRGKPELAKQLIMNGFYISYGEKLNIQSVKITPLEKICIETDESSVPIEEIYKNIATIKSCNFQDLGTASTLFDFNEC